MAKDDSDGQRAWQGNATAIRDLVEAAQQGTETPTAADFTALALDDGMVPFTAKEYAWHLMRQTGIGGSDVGAICGLSPFNSAIDVYQSKIGPAPKNEEDLSDALRFGHLLEPIVADEYRRRHETEVVVGPFDSWRHPDRHWHLVTVDGIVVDGLYRHAGDPTTSPECTPDGSIESYLGRIKRIVEVKTAGRWGAQSYGDGGDDLPPHVLAQTAHYMGGLDVDSTDVAALLTTNDFREFHVERDHALEAYLLEECDKFWQRVLRREPPPADGSASFGKYLKQRFPSTTGLLAPSTGETDQLAANLRSLKCLERRLAKAITQHEQEIQLAIGDSDGIDTSDGSCRFKHHKQGRVNPWRVAEELAAELDLTPAQFAEHQDRHRGKAPRVFNSPRNWLKDELTTEGLDRAAKQLANGNP